MKIRCPTCKSEYEFPEDRLKPEGTRVRCSSCSAVFLIRARTTPAPPGPPAPPTAPPPSAAADDDDLSAFFGGPPAADSGQTAEDDLDGLFGAHDSADDLFGGGDDLFSEPGSDGGDDLFSESPGNSGDDLFGTASDLFGDDAPAPARTGGPPAAATEPGPSSGSAAAADDDLEALFDDSDVAAPAPPSPAAPASSDAAGSVPDFDWDDDEDEAAADEEDDADLIEYGEAGFTPAIQEDDAREVLERTIVREPDESARPPRPRVGLILFIVFAILLSAAAGLAVLQPELVQYTLTQLGVQQPVAPPVAESPIHLDGKPTMKVVQNRNGFDVLVVEGVLRNDDQQPHSFVLLRVDLVDEQSGRAVTSETVYAGNDLSQLQLRNFPAVEMKRLLGVEMGEDLRNFNISPGQKVPFMAVFIPAPANYLELKPRVVVLNSVAGEQ